MDPLKAVRMRVTECLQQASLYYGREFREIPVAFDLSGNTAGSFCCLRNKETGAMIEPRFRFNRILARDNLSHFLSDTCPHEVAHYVTRTLWGKVKPHGKEWTDVMTQVFKIEADRCHSMDTSKAVKNAFRYKCGCDEERELSTVRHNRIKRGSKYRCQKCMQILVFVEQAKKAEAPVIERLYISTASNRLNAKQISKIVQLVADHQVRSIVADGLLLPGAQLVPLGKKLNVPMDAVFKHSSPETLPGGVSHAIVFADVQQERQGRIAKAFEQRGVRVRLVRAGVG